MYGNRGVVDNDTVTSVVRQLDIITDTKARVVAFMKYMNDSWKSKTTM